MTGLQSVARFEVIKTPPVSPPAATYLYSVIKVSVGVAAGLAVRMGQVGGWFPLPRSEDIGLSTDQTVERTGGSNTAGLSGK